MIIDLHGLTESEALLELDAFMWQFEDEHESSAEIIVGKGIVLNGVVSDFLNQCNLNWSFNKYNQGSIIVYKK